MCGDTPIYGRYIIIQIDTDNDYEALSLCEVEAYHRTYSRFLNVAHLSNHILWGKFSIGYKMAFYGWGSTTSTPGYQEFLYLLGRRKLLNTPTN